jgi:hypothetical protein
MTAYADRGITASQLDFERPFVYLELFAGQATLSVAAYPCSIGFKYVVACRGCQDPEDIEDSTKDPDVVWITRKIEQLDTSSLLGHPHGLLRKFKVTIRLRHRRSHVPDVYSALSREYEGVTGATCHTIKPWRRQASEFYNTLRRAFSVEQPATSAMRIRSSTVWRPTRPWKQYPGRREESQSGLWRLWRCSEEADGTLLRSDVTTSCTQRSRRKIASGFVSTFKYPPSLAHEIKTRRLPPH